MPFYRCQCGHIGETEDDMDVHQHEHPGHAEYEHIAVTEWLAKRELLSELVAELGDPLYRGGP